MVAWMLSWKVIFGRRLAVREELKARIWHDRKGVIKDAALLRKSGLILGATIVGFMLHGFLGYEPATVALLGASTLLLVSGADPQKALEEVEWSTIFFFMGLFIIIGGPVKAGLIDVFAQKSRADPPYQGLHARPVMVMVWFSGIARHRGPTSRSSPP
jgi:Na+/H+ antiporter NhaD/arsenite permease-like protein